MGRNQHLKGSAFPERPCWFPQIRPEPGPWLLALPSPGAPSSQLITLLHLCLSSKNRQGLPTGQSQILACINSVHSTISPPESTSDSPSGKILAVCTRKHSMLLSYNSTSRLLPVHMCPTLEKSTCIKMLIMTLFATQNCKNLNVCH